MYIFFFTNVLQVSAADIVNAEKFFGSLSHMTTSQLPHSRLLTLLGEKSVCSSSSSKFTLLLFPCRKKQLLAEDKQKKPTLLESIKTPDRTSESVGRTGLTYSAPDVSQQKAQVSKPQDAHIKSSLFCSSQEQQARKAFVSSYIASLAKEAISTDQRQVAIRQNWPRILSDMVHHLVAEMWDSKAYMKRCLEEIENKPL
jgi:leucine-rich repeat-containing protein 49